MGLKIQKTSSNNNGQRLSGLRRAAFIGCAVLVTTFALGASNAYAQGARTYGLGITSEEASSLDLSWLQKLRLLYHNHKYEQQERAARTQLQELKSEFRELAAEPVSNAAALADLTRQILSLRAEMVRTRSSYQASVMGVLNAEQRTELAELRDSRRERLAERARQARERAEQRLASARAEMINRALESAVTNAPVVNNGRQIAESLRDRARGFGHVVPRHPNDGLDANNADVQDQAGIDVRSISEALQSHARDAAPGLIEQALTRLQDRLDTPENTLQRVDS